MDFICLAVFRVLYAFSLPSGLRNCWSLHRVLQCAPWLPLWTLQTSVQGWLLRVFGCLRLLDFGDVLLPCGSIALQLFPILDWITLKWLRHYLGHLHLMQEFWNPTFPPDSIFPLIHALAGSRSWLKWLGSCLPHERPELSFWLLVLTWSNLCSCKHLMREPAIQIFEHLPVFLCISNK